MSEDSTSNHPMFAYDEEELQFNNYANKDEEVPDDPLQDEENEGKDALYNPKSQVQCKVFVQGKWEQHQITICNGERYQKCGRY